MTNVSNRYFKRQQLDYPQSDTPRSSRKFVKAMKHLHVRPQEPPPLFFAHNNVPEPPLRPVGLHIPTQPLPLARQPALAKNPYAKYLLPLQDTIPPHTEFNRKFLDLLKQIFIYDPKKRITAHQALQHEWFREHFEDDGTEAEKIRIERERADRIRRAQGGR